VTADDRMMALSAQESWAAGKAYRPEPAEDTRTHQDEIRAAHQGQPSIVVQSATHGAPLPAADKGPDPRGGAQ
jgi:hypothetical protein